MQGIIKIGTALVDKGFKEGVKKLKAEAITTDKEITNILSNSTKASKNLGNALGGVVKKATNLGSALFNVVAVGGLMGAVGLGAFILGKALDKANGKTEQLKTNLSYIGFVASKIFENLLQPAIDKTTGAVNGLVGALYKAVVYIGYILSKWTGKDLFAGTSAKDYAKSMESANKSAKKTAKATKQIKKDLMGFDEVDKLSENTTSDGGTGVSTSKVNMPNLPNIGDVKIPDWVKWIADNKDTILKVAGVILALLGFSKVVSWLQPLGQFFGLFTGGKLGGALSGVLGTLGSIVAIAGSLAMIGYSVYDLLEGNKQQRKQLNRMAERGLELAEEDVKEEKTLEETQEFLNYKRQQGNKVLEQSHKLGSKITGTTKEQLKNAESVAKQDKLYIDQQMEKFRKGELTNEQQQELIQMIKDEKGYTQDVFEELEAKKMSTKEIGELEHGYGEYLKELDPVYANQKSILQEQNDFWDKIYGRSKDTKTNVDQNASSTKTWWEKLKDVKDKIKNIADEKIPDKKMNINIDADTKNVTSSFSSFIGSIGTKISNAFKNANLDGFKNNIAGIFSKLMPNLSISNIKKKLGLRQGGIINNPGSGVAIGSNIIGGEAGSEAVLPLDDTTMDRLGSAIARHMVINTTNINQINGRTLSREVRQIMSENDFANNI